MGWRCVDRLSTATDCVVAHWMPQLPGGARRAKGEPAGWHADCPACGAGRALSVGLGRGGRPVWHQHCRCDDGAVGKAIADRVACWHHGRAPRGTAPKVDAAIAVLMDRTRSSSAKVVGALRELGVPDAEIWPALGLSRTQRYAVTAELGQKPRSQGASPENRTNGQVTAPLTRKATGVQTGRSQGDPVRKTGQKPRSEGVRKTGLGPRAGSPENRTEPQVTAPLTRGSTGLTTRGTLSAPAAPNALTDSTTPAATPAPDGTTRTPAPAPEGTPPAQGDPSGKGKTRAAANGGGLVAGLVLSEDAERARAANLARAGAEVARSVQAPDPGEAATGTGATEVGRARTSAARQAAIEKNRAYWAAMTPEEKSAEMARRMAGRTRAKSQAGQ